MLFALALIFCGVFARNGIFNLSAHGSAVWIYGCEMLAVGFECLIDRYCCIIHFEMLIAGGFAY